MFRTNSERRVIVRKVDYRKHGFSSRKEYLQDLAESYSLSYDDVLWYANDIGGAHDFGKLIQVLKAESQRIAEAEGFECGIDADAVDGWAYRYVRS